MKNIPESILIACLDALESGASIDSILAEYAAYAEALRPFLETAVLLNEQPLAPPPQAAALSKNAFLQAAADIKTAAAPPRRSWLKMLRPALALALTLVVLSTALISASVSALPGDTLYTTKRFVETLRLSGTSDPDGRELLLERFEQERVREVNDLIQQGRSTAVTFSGPLETLTETTWVVAGIPVMMTPDTTIEGTVVVGAEAQVNGRIENGVVMAITITLPDAAPAAPEPTPTPSPTATLAPPTETPSPAPTNTPTVAPSPSPTPTATDDDTAATVTAVPVDDADENDNADDDDTNEVGDDDNNNDGDSSEPGDDDGEDDGGSSGSGDSDDNDSSGSGGGDDGNANDDGDDDDDSGDDDSGDDDSGDDDSGDDDSGDDDSGDDDSGDDDSGDDDSGDDGDN